MELLLATINWNSFGLVLIILAVLAIFFTALIMVVHKLCAVEENPKIGEVTENLSGANCGGCGFAGCADFAKALVEGRASINDCSATSKEAKTVIASILGQTVENVEPKMAVVKCCGNVENTTKKYEYTGNESCQEKNLCIGGDKICSTACLGSGDCKAVCKFNAVSVSNGLAKINKDNCTACGTCVRNCPKKIIELIPKKAKVYVACSSKCKGKQVMDACKNGCIGCGLCAKSCPNDAITMVDNLPVYDYDKCTACFICLEKCPRKTIKKISD